MGLVAVGFRHLLRESSRPFGRFLTASTSLPTCSTGPTSPWCRRDRGTYAGVLERTAILRSYSVAERMRSRAAGRRRP
jgi:hypothetical protein